MSPEEARAKLEEVLPRLAEAASEQDGSRFLQWRLSKGNGDDAERDRIYEASLPAVVKLAGDVFGNFVVQKLFERGSEAQRTGIADRMKSEIFHLATHRYGCRVIQKMLELLPTDAQVTLTSELEGKVTDCVENMHGNHVVQIMVKVMPPPTLGFIISSLEANAERMAAHMYGCRVLQRLLERCSPEQLRPLLGRILVHGEKLASDRHGNYVIQCILERGSKDDKRQIIDVIRRNFVHFAKSKVSSNVVEKCFQAATVGEDAGFLVEEREALYKTVLGAAGDQHSPLRALVNDKFGNYTVQCVIRHSRGRDREVLRQRIAAMEPELRTQTGKHILACLKKLDSGEDPVPIRKSDAEGEGDGDGDGEGDAGAVQEAEGE